MNNTLEYLKHLDWERFAFALFLLLFGYFFALSLKYCIGQKMTRDEVLSAIKTTFERESITFVNERIYIPSLPSSVTPLPSSF